MPDWFNNVTFGQVWETIVWVGAVIAGMGWVWSRVKPRLARIEARAASADAKAEVAVFNTQSNHGSSPYDATQAALARLEGRVDCMDDRISGLTEHLGANHPGSVDPATGRPVIPPPATTEPYVQPD